MYTTLQTIKRQKACRGGFGRNLAFFGASPENRTQRIPLHVIALIGGTEDYGWTVTEGLTIDKQEFDLLFERTAFNIFQFKMARDGFYRGEVDLDDADEDTKLSQLILKKAFEVTNYAGLKALLYECKYVSFGANTPIFKLLKWPGWDDPVTYLKTIAEATNYKVDLRRKEVKKTHKSTRVKRLRDEDDEVEHMKYVFDNINVHMDKGERIAHVLKPTSTYDFLATMKFRKSGRAEISRDDTGAFIFRVTSPTSAFAVFKSALKIDDDELVGLERETDADEWEDLPRLRAGARNVRTTNTAAASTTTARVRATTDDSESDDSGSDSDS